MSHRPRSCVPLASPKWGSDTQICRFRRNFDQKQLKVCYKVSLSKNFQQQSCSGINYLSNDNNILAGDDPVPVKFGLQALTPNRKDARFTFHTRHAVQSAIADSFLLVFLEPRKRPWWQRFWFFLYGYPSIWTKKTQCSVRHGLTYFFQISRPLNFCPSPQSTAYCQTGQWLSSG